jgi:hypothetical protein
MTLNRSGRWRSCGSQSGVVLVLPSMRATSTSRRHRRARVQMRTICVSHVDKGEGWKNPRWREKMMRRKRNLIRVFYPC